MAIEYKKPTTYTTDSGTAFSNPAQAYDGSPGDETTCADQGNATDGLARWHTWASKVETYTATQLHVKWKTSGGFTNDTFAIEYTKNGGGAWLELVAMGVHNETTIQDSNIALDANQDLTQVEVRVNFDRVGGGDKDYLYIYDIWTEGTYTIGGVTVPINQIVSKVVMFAVTVLTGVTVLIGQLTANIVPYSVDVKISQTVPINLQTVKMVPYSPTIKTGAKVPINLLNTKITPYPVTVGGGISVPINLLTLKTNTIAPTISGGAKVSINQLINKTTPYPVIVDIGGIIVPINLITHRVIPYPVVVTSGVKVDVNQLINKIIPYSVTVAAPIKSVKGIVSETLHINGLISMDKDYIAPKGIVSNSFIIKGIMQLQ